MKAFFTLLLCAISPTLAFTQGWFADASVWHHAYTWGTATGFVRTTVLGDTLSNAGPGRRLVRVRETYNLVDQTYDTEALSDLVCKEEDGLVMILVPSLAAFDTLYDMNAVAGDRWQLPYLPDAVQNCAPDSWMEVVATGSSIVDDVLLRWSAVDIHFHSVDTTTYRDTVLERVGLTGMYFLPLDFCDSFIDGQEAGAFRCYSDAEVAYVANPEQACGFSVGLDEPLNTRRSGIHPNPSTGLLHIAPPAGPGTVRVQLFSSQGQLAFSGSIAPGQPLNLSSLPAGVYHLQVLQDSGRRYSERWVKE